MRSAMLVRTQLINEGTSAAAHLSLEHMLRGELGEHERASALVKQVYWCTSKAASKASAYVLVKQVLMY
jgi:hypothetical protein